MRVVAGKMACMAMSQTDAMVTAPAAVTAGCLDQDSCSFAWKRMFWENVRSLQAPLRLNFQQAKSCHKIGQNTSGTN